MLIQICATFGLAVTIRALAQFFTPDFRTIKIQSFKESLKSTEFLLVTLNYLQVLSAYLHLFYYIYL